MTEHAKNRQVPPGDRPRPRLLAGRDNLLQRLFEASQAARWGLSLARFSAALEQSAGKRFSSGSVSQSQLEEYLGTLHLEDLALGCACAEGCEAAWEHFVATYRSYLYSAAGAITRRSASDPHAREFADSLYAALYSHSRQTTLGRVSLFDHFYGRSKLSTWLRAVLAQRYVDILRQERRFEGLEDEEGHERNLIPQHRADWEPGDPDHSRYLHLLASALKQAISSLDASDRSRLLSYYMKELTLAQIGKAMNEHEATVSRKLERIRSELKEQVVKILRVGCAPENGRTSQPGLDDAQIQLCFEYATEAWPFDLSPLLDSVPPKRGVTDSAPRDG